MDAARSKGVIADLFDRWNGKPILVLGGGPSVSKDLPALALTPACVISANDHGKHQTRFPVDIFVNCDKIHCMLKVPMESILRPLGGLIVNRHSWADYRLAEWQFSGNSGLTAIAVAAALGGDPVLVTGIDMWKEGRIYFHDTDPAVVPRRRRFVKPAVTRRDRDVLRPLKAFVAGANVRPLSGPLTEAFPKFDPGEVLPAPRPVDYRRRMQRAAWETHTLPSGYRFGNQDVLRAATAFKMTAHEIARFGAKRPQLQRPAKVR
ncbi:MAG: hypothetical protein KAY22_16970 [Rhizorhabdus sp.]|uniref:hypothetical protein n=1 Tax=Rhizorhabdus sp. TaxID=1968843 RepID=UPI001B4A8102|nr:hypothetical protein [Rhizorhabdus sp.]MBP8233992.1 hypothetical protein [Rhizorhabdus sp.]